MSSSSPASPQHLIPNWRTGEEGFTKLPRGNHRISREEVLASQRGRILRAILELIGEDGPSAVSISEVARRAKISRKTYYTIFRSFNEGLNEAFTTAHLLLGAEMATAVASANMGEPYPRLRAMLSEFFQMASEEPVVALAICGSPVSTKNGLAPIWLDVRNAQTQILSSYWADDQKDAGRDPMSHPSSTAKLAVISLISAVILDALAAGEQDSLTEQVESVLDAVVKILSTS